MDADTKLKRESKVGVPFWAPLNVLHILFVTLILIVLSFPLAGMLWSHETAAVGNKEPTPLPSLAEGGAVNLDYLGQLGLWFQDHFAYRSQIITANAKLHASVFDVSTTDQVLLGKDGWEYFTGTLPDYLGRDALSERGIQNVAYNVSLMQESVEQRGATFLFTIAPNKNSVYPEKMPQNYIAGAGSNLDRLIGQLEKYDVSYVDVKGPLLKNKQKDSEEPVTLYFERDTHWNNRGAAVALDTLLDAAGKGHEPYTAKPFSVRDSSIGDLDRMLFPARPRPERDIHFKEASTYAFVGDADDVEEPWIETVNPSKHGTLLMYRDSFGNALIPLLANEFDAAYFTKYVPYDLGKVDETNPDTVIVERAERHIPYLGETPPIMPAPAATDIKAEGTVVSKTTISFGSDGSYRTISGSLDPKYHRSGTRIYVSLVDSVFGNEEVYRPFQTTVLDKDGNRDDYCFKMFLEEDGLVSDRYDVRVIIVDGEETKVVATDVLAIAKEK